jgi:hypothetical protein
MRTRWGLVIGAVLLAAVAGASCGDPAAYCPKIPSWDECAKASRCEPIRFTHHQGYEGPAWACQPKAR